MGKKFFTNIVWMFMTGVSCALGTAVYCIILKIMIALKCGLKMKNDKSMGKKNGTEYCWGSVAQLWVDRQVNNKISSIVHANLWENVDIQAVIKIILA